MKTLVVLSALAAIAVAAPSQWEKEHKTFPQTWTDTIKRDKKSPQGYFFAESTPMNIDVPAVHMNSEVDTTSATGRSFGLKKTLLKPTIIKKHHHGYHVYRDSDEERAQSDPQEDCSKQVKVKLCDGSFKVTNGRSTNDEKNIEENEMKSSIMMAKEAIEHLQRDLEQRESSHKMGSWSERETSSQNEFIEDIEAARKALDHIHKNFGNLESMSLKAADNLLPTDDKMKSHEERMAQWKENIDIVKNNIETGRNMEDILNKAEDPNKLGATELMRDTEMNTPKPSETFKDTDGTKEIHPEKKNQSKKHDDIKSEQTPKFSLEKSAEITFENKDGLLPENNIETSNVQGKSSDTKTNHITDNLVSATNLHPIMKASEDKTDVKVNHEILKNTELLGLETEHVGKSAEKEWNHNFEAHMEKSKSSLTEKSSESTSLNENKIDLKQISNEEKNTPNIALSMKAAEHDGHSGNVKDLINSETHETPLVTSIGKSSENKEPAGSQTNSLNMRWSPAKEEKLEAAHEFKSAGDFHTDNMNGMHMNSMHHTGPNAEFSHHVDGLRGITHSHLMNNHEHGMFHAKSADTDNFMLPNLQMTMEDFMGKSALENMLQWTHKHDAGRSAYGPGLPSSGLNLGGSAMPLSSLNLARPTGASGAVGVFPNANVGGCAVPLLLSCSPSVVSGSLAKSSYGHGPSSAPAYKAADNFNIHNKRDIKNTNEKTTGRITPKTMKQKTIVTEKKL